MDSWIALGKAADVPPGSGRTCVAGAHRIALFNDGGEFLAVDDTCPHQGASLGSGAFHEGRVIFDLRSGECPRGSHEPVRVYPTRCENGTIQVQLDADPPGTGDVSGTE